MPLSELKNCNRCGLCLSVCPVYNVLLEEQSSPRAKLHLIQQYDSEHLAASDYLQELVTKCLMCGACADICPSGINHFARFMDMREEMTRVQGDRTAIKSMVYLLARESRIKAAAGLLKMGQKITPSYFFDKYNIGNLSLKNLPKLNEAPFRHQVPHVISPGKTDHQAKIKGHVLYFTGCATNYLFDQTGFATICLLNALGYEVIIPEKQSCCGIPMLFHGAKENAKKSIAVNLSCLDPERYISQETHNGDSAADQIQAIIVDCPTCGSALQNEYPAIANEMDEKARRSADRISSRVMDIISFIHQASGETPLSETLKTLQEKVRHLKTISPHLYGVKDPDDPVSTPLESPGVKVTYHLPCHLKNGLKKSSVTQVMLEALPHVEYVPTPDADMCCGGGGTFFYEYPDVSQKMVQAKVENAKKTHAAFWVTDCPVCRINLAGNLEKTDAINVIHPVEVI